MRKSVSGNETVKVGKTLLVTADGKDFKITIPVGGRVTFGPTVPYQKTAGDGYQREHRGYSLRVYESAKADSLIAVFAGVSGFRDISMPHATLVIREAGKSVWKSDEEGYKVETEVKQSKGWEVKQLESLNPQH